MDNAYPKAYFSELLQAICHKEVLHSVNYKIANKNIKCHYRTEQESYELFNLALFNLIITETENFDLDVHIANKSYLGFFVPPPKQKCKIINCFIEDLSTCSIKFYYYEHLELFIAINFETKQAIYWFSSDSSFPISEFAVPFRHLWHSYFSEYKVQMLHAGSVGVEGNGVLLIGKGGSGKSTTALNCLQAGMQFLGDDYVLTSVNSSLKSYSLSHTAKVTPFSNTLLPNVRMNSEKVMSCDEKKLLIFGNYWKNQLINSLDLKAIILPCVSKENLKLTFLSPQESFKALAPNTMGQLIHTNNHNYTMIAELVKQLPSYRLELGSELKEIPVAIEKLIKNNGVI